MNCISVKLKFKFGSQAIKENKRLLSRNQEINAGYISRITGPLELLW